MKKIFVTIMMTLAIMSANASEVNIAELAMTRMSNTNVFVNNSDSLFYTMPLNDKLRQMKRSFNLDEYQLKYLIDVQKSVENGFKRMNEISDAGVKERYFDNLLKYWRKESMIAFENTPKIDWRKDYKKYWTCVNVTLINKNYTDGGKLKK